MPHISTGKDLIDPFKVLEEVGVRAGMKVADFGCGALGHYIFPAAKLVGSEGKIYAVDILKDALQGVESRMKLEGLSNVETVWGNLDRINGVQLPDNFLDIGLLINNLFLSPKKEILVRESMRMIKKGGTFVVIDWKSTGGFGPDPAVRVSLEDAKKILQTEGLIITKEFSPGAYHYGLIVMK